MSTQTLSRRIRAAEDIQIGDFIVVTHTRYQLLPGPFDPLPSTGEEITPQHVMLIPPNAGTPLKVVALSLPFVMTESHHDDRIALDTRQHVLARVSKDYAMSAKRKRKRKKENDYGSSDDKPTSRKGRGKKR